MSRTDRLLADVERGFTALEDGRIDDAAASLERVQRIDRTNPDVIALAAGVADARGDVDGALSLYAQLVQLNPDDAMPRICMARMQLHDKHDPEAALASVTDALEFIDDETALIEAVLVRTEALIQLGNLVDARESLSELASEVIDDGALALDLAELALAAEDAAAATRWIESARKAASSMPDGEGLDPDSKNAFEADALHLQGRVYEATDDRPQMIATFKKVRALDDKMPPGPVEVSDDEVERIAQAALAELPAEVRAKLVNVPILIDQAPSDALLDDGLDPRILGLFQGASLPDGGELAPAVTNILLFKRNLERAAHDVDHLAEEIRITVLHETAHYFGLDEEELEAIGLD